MLSQFLLLTLAGVASAEMVLPRAPDTTTSFQATTTMNAHSSECSSMSRSIFSDAPKAPFDIADYLGCSGLPSSLTAAYTTYLVTALSWVNAHNDEIESLQTSCPGIIPSPTANVKSISCTYTGTDLAAFTALAGSRTTAASRTDLSPSATSASTAGATPTGATAGGDAGTNAGNRETGLAWAAVAIAGVLGAVAML